MNEAQHINELHKELHLASQDIKAEVQMLLALEKGLFPEHFLISPAQRFRREYSKDIVGSDIREDANKQPFIELHLSRSSIYDHLPEGLFFQSNIRRRASITELAADYRLNKKKESDIRKFFQPFDHDFFLQRLSVEEEENRLLEGIQSGMLNEYFVEFWDLPDSLPRYLVAPLILLLPYASKIAGDLDLTAQSLQLILKEKVSVRKGYSGTHDATETGAPVLGDAILGLDMVCGSNFWEDTPVFEIKIGPVQYSQITDYLEGGHRCLLLETFQRFFIPVGVETTVNVIVAPEKRNMTLTKGSEPILGYSSYL